MILLLLLLLPPLIFLYRIVYTLRNIYAQRKRNVANNNPGSKERSAIPISLPVDSSRKLLVVLGSGGHTAEMLTLLSDFFRDIDKQNNLEITYVTSATDNHSQKKIQRLHTNAAEGSALSQARTSFIALPRAREVGESIPSSIISTCRCFLVAIGAVNRARADVLLINGPATSAVVAFVTFLKRVLGGRGRIVYVESFARVKTLSLSGLLCYRFVDRFVVQWPMPWLPMAEFYGRLV